MCRLVFFFFFVIYFYLTSPYFCVCVLASRLVNEFSPKIHPLNTHKKNRKDPSDGLMMSELRPEKNKGASPVERNL